MNFLNQYEKSNKKSDAIEILKDADKMLTNSYEAFKQIIGNSTVKEPRATLEKLKIEAYIKKTSDALLLGFNKKQLDKAEL